MLRKVVRRYVPLSSVLIINLIGKLRKKELSNVVVKLIVTRKV